MKCPNCGEEIDEVWQDGSDLMSFRAYFKEVEDGVFEYYEHETFDCLDSQVNEVVCPECEGSLKWKVEDGKLVIEH